MSISLSKTALMEFTGRLFQTTRRLLVGLSPGSALGYDSRQPFRA